LREFASTLAVVVIDDYRVRVGQVGDTIVVIQRSDLSIESVAPSERGEYFNETTFVTSDDWESELRTSEFPSAEITAIAASTDGLQFKILHDVRSGSPYVPFFEDLFTWSIREDASDEGIIRFVDVLDDQSGDDKTLLVAVRITPHGVPSHNSVRNHDQADRPSSAAPRRVDKASGGA
jgi:hypothetical protein